MQETARHRLINVLRGLAAMAVALFHFNEPYPPLTDWYHLGVKWGWLGVPVFFVVSGYCIAAAGRRGGLIAFWWRRLWRIYPPYWASLGLVAALVGWRVLGTGTNDITVLPKDPASVAYTLAALTAPASAVPAMNWVYWSLGYEVAFYVLFGLLAVPVRPRGAGGAGAGVASERVPADESRRVTGRDLALSAFTATAIFLPGFPFDGWGMFGLGVACHRATQRNWGAALVLGGLSLLHILMRQSPAQLSFGLVTAALIVFPPRLVLRGWSRPLAWVGEFSYSLYLTHVPIGCYLLPRSLPFMANRDLPGSLVWDGVALGAALAAAFLFYRLVEKPAHNAARRSGGAQGRGEAG